MDFRTYPKIKQIGSDEIKDLLTTPDDEIVIEEKVDGANFRFMVSSDGRIVFGSRSQSLGDDKQDIGGNWKRCVEHIKSKSANFLTDMPYIYYGECMVQHSIAYDWQRVPPFLGFDILDLTTGKFLNWEARNALFKRMGLDVVPHIKTCKASEITKLDDSVIPQSSYYPGQAEGLMFKNYGKQMFGKHVTEKFKEVNKAAFGGGKKHAKNDNELFVATYCTNPRIDKAVFKLVHNGEPLNMALMHKLPRAVVADMWAECWQDLITVDWTFNPREVYKMVGKRCLAVLKQVITNNALQQGEQK